MAHPDAERPDRLTGRGNSAGASRRPRGVPVRPEAESGMGRITPTAAGARAAESRPTGRSVSRPRSGNEDGVRRARRGGSGRKPPETKTTGASGGKGGGNRAPNRDTGSSGRSTSIRVGDGRAVDEGDEHTGFEGPAVADSPDGRREEGARPGGRARQGRRREGRPDRVEVRRSARRRRTVSAYRDGDRVIVLLPDRMSRAEERRWVDVMVERLDAQERRRFPSDAQLLERSRTLCRRYLDDAVSPVSVRWVGNQDSRWGSCTPSDGTVRLSSRLRGMPSWVVDYVLVHELAHLLEPGHTKEFWTLVRRYPQADRARGYLEGVAAAAHLSVTDCD